MKVLQLNRKILKLLGVCLERDAMLSDFFLSGLVNVLVLTTQFAIIEYSAVYFYRNVGIHLGDALFSLMPVVGFLAISSSYASFTLNKFKVSDFLDELQVFVDESMRANPNQ